MSIPFLPCPPPSRFASKCPPDGMPARVYSWVGSTPLCGGWPGSSMTLDNDRYYSYDISGYSSLPIGVVFNNGSTSSNQQTVDLFTSTDKCWEAGTLSVGKYTANEVTCPNVGMEELFNETLKIYPNPTHDRVSFTVSEQVKEITVTSVLGNRLDIKPSRILNTCQFDLSDYPSGVYYITLMRSDGTSVSRALLKY
ncbi:MAG: starch-binding protein [Bacteroidales bacterium]|nr:starch-binding protein [Bacteroidales bacterium]